MLTLEPADAISGAVSLLDAAGAVAMATWRHSFTIWGMGSPSPLACMGVREEWPGRGWAWAYLARGIRPYMPELVRGIARCLKSAPFHRIEAAVDLDYTAGHRLVKLLGFQSEGLMRKFTEDQRDAVLYARIT